MISTEKLTNYHISAKVVLERARVRLLIFVLVTGGSALLLPSIGGLVLFFEKHWRYLLSFLAVVGGALFIWLLDRHAAKIAKQQKEEA